MRIPHKSEGWEIIRSLPQDAVAAVLVMNIEIGLDHSIGMRDDRNRFFRYRRGSIFQESSFAAESSWISPNSASSIMSYFAAIVGSVVATTISRVPSVV